MNQRSDSSAEKSIEDVLRELAEGRPAPCYLLYGEEEFALGAALERMIALLLPAERELNLFTVGPDEPMGLLCDTLLTPPLLPGRKVVLARETRLFHSRHSLPELLARIRETAAQELCLQQEAHFPAQHREDGKVVDPLIQEFLKDLQCRPHVTPGERRRQVEDGIFLHLPDKLHNVRLFNDPPLPRVAHQLLQGRPRGPQGKARPLP